MARKTTKQRPPKMPKPKKVNPKRDGTTPPNGPKDPPGTGH